MQKREAKFCTELQKWLSHNFKESCVIEAKVSTDNKPFNYKSGFKSHQLRVLSQIKHGSFAYKLSDLDQMIKPFDILFLKGCKSYVAIMWIRKGNKIFYFIDPDTIQGEMDDGKKSLTEERARELSILQGELRS